MQGESLLFGRAPVRAPRPRLVSGPTPAAHLKTPVSTTTWRSEPSATVPQRVLVPATRSKEANASHQPVDAPIAQEAGAAFSTTGTSTARLDPACQMNCSEPPPTITPALFWQTAKPTPATPADTGVDGLSVPL